MINVNMVEEMKNLSALNYTPDAIKTFLVNFSLEEILRNFLNGSSNRNNKDAYIINTTVKKLINDRDTFKLIISDKNLKEVLEQFVGNERTFYRELIAEGILSNVATAREIFEFFKDQEDNPIVEGYINIIYHLFSDDESSVGLKISKFFVKFAAILGDTEDTDYLFTSAQSIGILKKLLKCDNAVVELRTLEMVIKCGNKASRLYSKLEQEGVVSMGLKLYKKYASDILEKLNLVDIVGRMGSTEIGSELLTNHNCFKLIRKEALGSQSDPFVTKSLATLLIDLMTHGQMKYKSKLLGDLQNKLTGYLMGGFGEELYTCYDMINAFGRSVEGYMGVYKNRQVMKKLFGLCHSNIDLEHQKALGAVLGLLYPKKKFLVPSKKGKIVDIDILNMDTNHSIEFLFIYIGNPQLVDSYIDIKDTTVFDSSIKYFYKNLMLPFPDIEEIFLRMTLSLIQIDRFLMRFVKNSECFEYLIRKSAKGKVLFDLKEELKKTIKGRLDEYQAKKKDTFVKNFFEEWKAQSQARKVELMQYKTGTN